jgi:hypothetical protein
MEVSIQLHASKPLSPREAGLDPRAGLDVLKKIYLFAHAGSKTSDRSAHSLVIASPKLSQFQLRPIGKDILWYRIQLFLQAGTRTFFHFKHKLLEN